MLRDLFTVLDFGLNNIQCTLTDQQKKQLINLITTLHKWNKSYSLTAIKQLEKMVIYHLLDSLAVTPYLIDGSVLDVGTGPGFPGLPLAIARPDMQFFLLDSSQKKINFITHAIASCQLRNVVPVHSRVQGYKPQIQFNNIISRAFSKLSTFSFLCDHLMAPHTQLLAMQGQVRNVKIGVLAKNHKVVQVNSINVPGLDAERCIISIALEFGQS